jgi:hypothetical protein
VKVTIRDKETLSSIHPLDVAAYLRSHGWHEAAVEPGKVAWWTWTDPAGNPFEVLLPLDRRLADFAYRMSDILKALEVAEQRTQIEILRDIEATSADLVRIPATYPEAGDGTMPLEDEIAFSQHVRDLVLAAACSTVEPRPAYQSRKPTQAMDYLRNVRVGQTERGSYVLTIVSRVAPALTAPAPGMLLALPEEPFERQVTATLAQALTAAQSAAIRAASTGSIDEFDAVVGQGVSANLCEALAGLERFTSGDQGLAVAFSWSPTRPSPSDAPRRVVLPKDALPFIREAGRLFRARNPREDFELHGLVVRLDRPQGATTGKVTIFGFVDGQPRNIVVELGEADYKLAIQAHQDRVQVVCFGDLVKEGRGFQLRNPHHFSLEPSDPAT